MVREIKDANKQDGKTTKTRGWTSLEKGSMLHVPIKHAKDAYVKRQNWASGHIITNKNMTNFIFNCEVHNKNGLVLLLLYIDKPNLL